MWDDLSTPMLQMFLHSSETNELNKSLKPKTLLVINIRKDDPRS